jgi:hypothetical protein
MEEAAFERLTDRLHVAAATRFRDSWVACDKCDRWREIPPTQSLAQIGASATWRCGFAYPSQGCAAPLTDRELKAFSVARKGHALALKADKNGTDIRNGDPTGAREVLDSARPSPFALPAASAPRDAEESHSEDGASEGWRKVEKTEDDTRDAGDRTDLDEETEEDALRSTTRGEALTTTKKTPTDPATDPATDPPTEPPPDPMDAWLDEVSLRGGRKRFALHEAPIRPRVDARKKRTHRETRVGDGDGSSAAEDARMTDFERERAANVARNRETLASMFGGPKTPATRADATDAGAEDPRALADRLERAAAEASSALAVATRALKTADATCAKAEAASEASVARARRAAASAAVAEKEARAAESEALDARAEALAARAVVERLAALADEAEARCDAAAQAAG